jgi:hypothetical protein
VSNLARIPAVLQRWPALVRAVMHGVIVEVSPGVTARLRVVVEGSTVHVPIETSGTLQTLAGPVQVRGQAVVSAHVDTIGRALDAAERRGMVPRLSQLLDGNGGRPLLNLPR